MTDRILRDKLLRSDRWLDMPRNTHRLAFICLIPSADPLGNMEASDGRMWRLWREPLKLDDRSAVPEILEKLVAADLIRLYEADGKRYLHIPRYRQRLRYLGRLFPLSPWTTNEEKQRVENKSPGDSQATVRRAPAEVKRSEVKRSEEKQPLPNSVDRARTQEQVKTVLENINLQNNPQTNRSRDEQLAYVAAHSKPRKK